MLTPTNPREVIGGNQTPDFAKIETERLVDEYQGFKRTLVELAAEAEAIEVVTADDEALKAGGIIKRFRDLYARLENTRVVEVEPDLRRMNAKNAFFGGLKKIIQPDDRRERRTSPGHIDVLQDKINVYQDEKEARERARLEAERVEAERVAEEARKTAEREQAEADRLQREADQRQLEADRARAPAAIEQKAAIATETGQQAAAKHGDAVGAQVAADRATEQAKEARIATFAKPADIVRTRGVTTEGAGVTLTKARESYAYVNDRNLLDKDKLWNSFTDDQIQMALGKWARATGHNEKMAGAEIGWRSKGVTR